MKTLYDFCRLMNATKNADIRATRPDKYMDILLSLINMIEEGTVKTVISPFSIIVDEGTNDIQLKKSEKGDLHYCPPEVIYGGGAYDAAAQLFSLGMTIFYMIYLTDCYVVTKTRTLEIEEARRKLPDSLISVQGANNSVFPDSYFQQLGQIMKELTSWNPSNREKGKIKLIEMYGEIESDNRIYFIEGNTAVASTAFKTKTDTTGFPKGPGFFRKGGVEYRILKKIDIPYRPGTHIYRIEVARR